MKSYGMNRRILPCLLFCCCSLVAYTGFGANVLWNTFEINDFSSWEQGAWTLGSGLPYAPGVGFHGNGTVWADGSFNVDGGGSYWVHSALNDAIVSFSDYEERRLLADVGFTGMAVVVGEGLSGGHEYLAIIGYTSNLFDSTAKIETYYGWIELNGKEVVASAITADGPLRVGTGEVIPEPTSGFLCLIGLLTMMLSRRQSF